MSRHHPPARAPSKGLRALLHRIWASARRGEACLAPASPDPRTEGGACPAPTAQMRLDALEARMLMASTPLITEFMASNSNGIQDEDGHTSDWIELHNPSSSAINLDGYYLTDQSDDPDKWRLPAVTLPGGGHMIVFASDKNRAIVDAELHTNFNLSADGGYLALIAPDGVSVVHQYAPYPEQLADLSYGIALQGSETNLIGSSSGVKLHVPASGSLGTTWTANGFDDGAWDNGTTGVGYDLDTTVISYPGFKVHMIDTSTGSISNIGTATTLLNGNTSGFTVVFNNFPTPDDDRRALTETVNFGTIGGVFSAPLYPDENHPNDPGGQARSNNLDPRREGIAMRITTSAFIPAGTYTINVGSDDGFRLTMSGVTFFGRVNEQFTGAPNPSPADTLVYGAGRGHGNTFAAFTVPEGGISTNLQLDYYEGARGDDLELSIASGQQTTFSTGTFQLLKDGALGWRLSDTVPPVTYSALINTDVAGVMKDIHPGIYVRAPFGVLDPDAFDQLRLKMRYDDGFVAYVNGVEIARRNAPEGTVAWDASASTDRADTAAIVRDDLVVDIPPDLLVIGQNTLAIHALNDAAGSLDFLIYPELIGVDVISSDNRYFTTVTPGEPNSASGLTARADDPSFSHDRGFYEQPFSLLLETDTPGAQIRYTLDGSAPTATTGFVYSGPLQISGTTTLRAASFKAGLLSSEVDSQTYIFLDDVINQSPQGQTPPGWPASWSPNVTDYGMDPDVVQNMAYGVTINGVYYFAAGDPATGLELWRSDGTAAGTFLLKDINPGANGSGPSLLTNVNGTLFFRANTVNSGYELWKSNGTAAGTVMVRELSGGIGSRFPYAFTAAGSKLFFVAGSSSQGTELWVSDGSSAGTFLVKDINATGTNGANSSTPASLTAIGSTVYFSADNGINGRELWKSDGTSAGTVMVRNINATGTNGVNSSNPASLAVLDGVLYFSANDGVGGTELWKSDGTSAGTVRVADILGGSGSSNPQQLTATASHIYFIATTTASGTELWRSDGTTATMISDITPGAGGTTITALTTSGGLAYFSAATASGAELWRSDGTSSGTFELEDINPGTGSSNPTSLTDVNGVLYFAARDGASGYELWRSTGSAAGTTFVKDVFAGDASSNPMWFAARGSDVMFIASNHTALMEIWKTTGTQAGTTLVKSLAQGNEYLRIDDLKSIPTFSITMNQTDLFGSSGIYSNPSQQGRSWERPASIELIYPDGTQGFQADAGIRLRGGFSRSAGNPKHAFRFIFRPEYGDAKLDFPLFGADAVQEFDSFDLRTFQNYSWSFQNDPRGIFLRDQHSRDTANAMGATGPHGDYYHLYINGQYWGLFNTEERPEAEFNASYFGGDPEDYDVIKHNSGTITATDGNMLAWADLWNQTMDVKTLGEGSQDTLAAYMKMQGKNSDGTRNPDYPVLVDIDNLIDYMLVIFYGGNLDSPLTAFGQNSRPNNFYAARNRNSDEGFRFFVHDAEHTLLNVNEDRTGPFNTIDPNPAVALSKSNAQYMLQNLAWSPEFRLRVADRIHRAFFNDGALTPAKNLERFMARANEIERAVVAESARWGDAKRPPNLPLGRMEWLNEVHRITVDDPATTTANDSYFSRRTDIVFNQLEADGFYPDAAIVQTPEFNQNGGSVAPGFQLIINNPGPAGSIYYMLDGGDPRLVGGGLNPGALLYTGPVALDVSATVKARVRLSDGTWSALNEKTFILPFTRLKVSELMYNNPIPAGSGLIDGDLDYIELINTGSTPIPLTNVSFNQGITFTFPPGSVLAGGARTLVVQNLTAFREKYGDAPHVSGVYTGSLSNSGETIALTDSVGAPILSFEYSDDWYSHTDGDGFSLVVRNPALASGAILSSEDGWRPSNVLGGGPGIADPGMMPNIVIINEVVANATGPLGDWIELRNTTLAPIDISGWFLSDSATDLTKFRIPEGTTINPGATRIFNWLNHFGVAGNQGANTPFDLSAGGADVYLSNNDGADNAAGYRDHVDFGASDPDIAMGRYIKSDDSSDFTAISIPTPLADNAAPVIGPVVINEIMYNPNAGDREFIELRNLTGQEVSLAGWKLFGVDYVFGPTAVIPAFGYALIVSGNVSTFRSSYGVPGDVPIYGPYLGDLANSGEDLKLSKPVSTAVDTPFVLVDKLKYNDTAPWPTDPDGTGPSLSRIDASLYGNDVANWASSDAAPGTPGLPNFAATGPVVDAGGDAAINQGETLARGGSFADPDADTFSATVNWGDGSATAALALNPDNTFNLSRTYANPGTYFVSVNVSDGTTTTTDIIRLSVRPGTRTGSGAADNWAIRLDAGGMMVHFFDNIPIGATPSFAVPLASLGSVSYLGQGGADSLTIDMANGSPIPAGGITFNGGAGSDQLHIIGSPSANTFTLGATQFSSAGRISSYSNAEQVLVDGNASDDILTVTETVPTPLVFNGGAGIDTLAVTGGSHTFNNDLVGGSSNLHLSISNSASATFNTTQHLAGLTLAGAATASLVNGVLVTSDLQISGTAALNLNANDLIYAATPATRSAAMNSLFTWIANGLSPSPSTLPRIFSSADSSTRGLGLALNDLGGGRKLMNTFAGESVGFDDILVKFTYKGDANLNGRVSIADFLAADRGSARGLAGWVNGDFNYSGGAADGTDYFLIDQAFLTQGGPLAAAASTADPTPAAPPSPSPAAAESIWGAPSILQAMPVDEPDEEQKPDVLSVESHGVIE